MTRTAFLTRRAFVSGLAAAILTLRATPPLVARTPSPGIAINPAHVLRDTLTVAPVTSYEGVLLEPVPWVGTSFSPYMSSVGGVHVLITDRSAAPFGSYVVYLDETAAQAGLFLGKRALEKVTITARTVETGDYAVDILTYEDSVPRSIALVPVSNVLVIGNDTVVRTEDAAGYEDNEVRAFDHAEALIGHLLAVIERRGRQFVEET